MAETTLPSRPYPSTTEPAQAAADWPRTGMRRFVFVGLCAALAVTFFLSLSLGSVDIPVKDIIKILIGDEPQRRTWTTIIIQFRLPKAVTAALAGAALAVAGLEMQTLFRNPLADPFILGINSGASLGVALVVLSVGVAGASATSLLAGLGLVGNFGLVAAASIGSGAILGIMLIFSQRIHNTMTLLILGLMVGYATSALVSLMLYFSIAERVHAYINWTFGSFGGVSWSQMNVLAPVILAALITAYALVKPLNALLLGETYARTMGLNVQRARIGIIISAAVLAGSITAFCGPIGFLGIAVPHLARSLFNTSDHRVLLPACTMLGAVLALGADIIAQLPGSQTVLPLNAITALIGAPVVVWVILRQNNLKSAFAG
ncbi:MAG: iron ABC transporter permease [Anaerolineae bacterium]|nr:iron ABC transporter permease [Anaerolineae bacterium]